MEFNCFLCTSVKKFCKLDARILYLPVQIHFHNKTEFAVLFNDDGITLNEVGRMRLKRMLMELAGFIRNDV